MVGSLTVGALVDFGREARLSLLLLVVASFWWGVRAEIVPCFLKKVPLVPSRVAPRASPFCLSVCPVLARSSP